MKNKNRNDRRRAAKQRRYFQNKVCMFCKKEVNMFRSSNNGNGYICDDPDCDKMFRIKHNLVRMQELDQESS